ncbi:MAG: phenylacetate--CoA ligase family protein [Hydrocarboniphaga sp.]|uniref:phenylacetate--CoA ligase family protein n=1 Tax=Hydrocarboniphaga sp. TaxID=2033016 RepID=UPI002619F86C|nr:AMP-binding protein [Hydrocarboniphaga sp.]MDB5969924.1 phenylacetate--CoA ligase family protein [Hydrocarboniphaga sp.]
MSVATSAPTECVDERYYDPWRETMPRADIEQFQQARLLELLPRAYKGAPLIRSTWEAAGLAPQDIRSLADFKARAPFIDKDHIRAWRDAHGDPMGGMLMASPDELVTISSTSGTTGEPTPIPHGMYTAVDQDLMRGYWHMGARPGDAIVFLMFTYRGGMFHAHGLSRIGLTAIPIAHDPAEIPRFVAASRQFRPTVLMMLSSPLIIGLEQYFEKTGIDPLDVFSSYKGVMFGGEPLSPRFAALVKSWGLELFEFTTLGDVSGAVQCRMHDGMHASEDLALVENLDDDGKPVPDGQIGEMVVTSLADDHAPMIRYRTEDLVRMDHSPCACGRTHARFWPIGRKGDQILVDGRSILPRDIQPLVEAEHETRSCLFQIIRPQRDLAALRLRVGYEPALLQGTADGLAARLSERLRSALNVPVQVELTPCDELLKLGPPHKIPRVTRQ